MFYNYLGFTWSKIFYRIWVWCSRKAVIDSTPLVYFPFSQEYIVFIIIVGRRSYVFTMAQFFFFRRCFICILVPFHACKCQMILGSMNDMSYAKYCWGESNNEKWICENQLLSIWSALFLFSLCVSQTFNMHLFANDYIYKVYYLSANSE